MSMISPENTCFMGDEAMAVCNFDFDYSVDEYDTLINVLTDKAKELGPEWRVADVERALFCIAMEAPLLAARVSDDTSATSAASAINAAGATAADRKRDADNETEGNSAVKKLKTSST